MTPDDIVARIDPQEVIDLALALGNIDSPTASEGAAGEYVHAWLREHEFHPRRIALTPDRINVAATLDGTGGGCSRPAVSYAPRASDHALRKAFRVQDLVDAARVYARIATDLCNQDRPPYQPLGAHPNPDLAAHVQERPRAGEALA